VDADKALNNEKKIIVRTNGAYIVRGNIPLVRKIQIVSECGEPLTWKTVGTIPTRRTYSLCRCGKSGRKPFCNSQHIQLGFDGTETADTEPTSSRQEVYPGSKSLVVKHDDYLCSDSGFCGNRYGKIDDFIYELDDVRMRVQVISMVEHCPSGALVYSLHGEEEDIEPDYPQQIAVTTEITSDGPIEGPLWVTGFIPVERADGQPFETRNRVALCRCGLSKKMPLCDGSHRTEAPFSIKEDPGNSKNP
jgi:CDGSH-type Zn-finger protein